MLQVEDGRKLAGRLEEMGIYVEMADSFHLVCILTAADGERDILRFKRALNFLGLKGPSALSPPDLEAPPLPRSVLTPRQARFAPAARGRLDLAEGKVAAQAIAPIPPRGAGGRPGRSAGRKKSSLICTNCVMIKNKRSFDGGTRLKLARDVFRTLSS